MPKVASKAKAAKAAKATEAMTPDSGKFKLASGPGATGGFRPARKPKVHHGGEFARGGGRVSGSAKAAPVATQAGKVTPAGKASSAGKASPATTGPAGSFQLRSGAAQGRFNFDAPKAAKVEPKPKVEPKVEPAAIPDLRKIPGNARRTEQRILAARFIKSQRHDAKAEPIIRERAAKQEAIRDTVLALKVHREGGKYAVPDDVARTLHQSISSGYRPHGLKDVDPLTLAHAEIEAARSLQRTRNFREAERRGVETVQGEKNWEVELYETKLKDSVDQKASDVRALAKAEETYKKLAIEREKLTKKVTNYSLSKKTRDKHDKTLEDTSAAYHEAYQAYNDLKYKVHGWSGDDRGGHHDEMIRYYRGELGKALATHGDGKVTIDHRADHAANPDRIPAGAIGDRIGRYKVGNAKLRHIEAAESRFDTKDYEVSKEISALEKEKKPVMDAIHANSSREDFGSESWQAELRELDKKLDPFIARHDQLDAKRDGLKKTYRDEVGKILAVKESDQVFIEHDDVPEGFKNYKGEPLSPLSDVNNQRATDADRWLRNITRKGDQDGVVARLGEGQRYRAHHHDSKGYIQIDTRETTDVIVHEYGHFLENKITTGGTKLLDRSAEFLDYRVKDETPIDMHAKYGSGDPGEMGRKDKFDQVFSESSAYYVGKVYGIGKKAYGTEILSMGAQELYTNPGIFARRDPEYGKYIIGALDGSLR
jgi:hypothetical protein